MPPWFTSLVERQSETLTHLENLFIILLKRIITMVLSITIVEE